MKTLIALLSLIALSATADTLVIPMVSKHVGAKYDFNEVNTGIGFQHGAIGVVAFKNSYDDSSVFGYYDLRHDGKYLSCGAMIGGVSGYEAASLIPMVTPYIEAYGVNLAVITSFIDDSGSRDADLVFTLSYRIKL